MPLKKPNSNIPKDVSCAPNPRPLRDGSATLADLAAVRLYLNI